MHLIIISKRNTACPRNRLGILIWIFLHQVLDYHDVSMKAYLDLTLYMILHCSCLVWTALYSLYMPMYVQKPCSRCLYAADQPHSLFTCPPQTHIWISKNLYIFLDASTNILLLTGWVIIGCNIYISALQITLFTQGAADEGNALLIFSFGVCRTMMVYCCTIYQNVLWHWHKSNIWTF